MSIELTERQQIEKRYHDNKYREHGDSAGGARTRAYTRFWGIIGLPKGLTILDFGCGNGWLSVLLADLGNRVYGFDISEVLIGMAQKFAEESKVSDRTVFKEMAAENIDFPPETFDLIVGSSILHHTDLDVTLLRIKNVLKADGTAIFMEPLNQNLLLRLWRLITPWRRTETERALTHEDLERIRRFFPATQFHYYCLTSMFSQGLLIAAPRSRALGIIHDRLEDLDEWLLTALPSMGRFSAVVVLQMRK